MQLKPPEGSVPPEQRYPGAARPQSSQAGSHAPLCSWPIRCSCASGAEIAGGHPSGCSGLSCYLWPQGPGMVV